MITEQQWEMIEDGMKLVKSSSAAVLEKAQAGDPISQELYRIMIGYAIMYNDIVSAPSDEETPSIII